MFTNALQHVVSLSNIAQMSALMTFLYTQAMVKVATPLPFGNEFDQNLNRVIAREGQIGVTRNLASDTRGGATQAGISQSYFGKNPDGSWKKSPAQIAALSPAQIRSIYADIYRVPNQFQDPRVREVMFDMTTNVGPRANKMLQATINQLDRSPAARLKEDGLIGDATLNAAKSLDQGRLANGLLDRYSAHHQNLVKSKPKLYGNNKNGWANRIAALRQRVEAESTAMLGPYNPPTADPMHIPTNGAIAPQKAKAIKLKPFGPPPAPARRVWPIPFVGPPAPTNLRPIPGGTTSALSQLSERIKSSSLSAHLRRARNSTHTHPTPAQASAGNYAKGSLILHGMHIKLENPKGTERRGYDKDGNITWRRTMAADYGYFVGTKAIDGDAVDCFIGEHPESHFVVAIDQQNEDGSFDETKFVLGCHTQEQAEKLYLAHYPRGWKLGPVSTTTVQQLKEWLKNGDTKAPFKGQMVKAAKDYGHLLHKLRLRRGECPVCAKPNQDPYPPCGCDPSEEPRAREKEAKSRYGDPDFKARIQAENDAFDRAVEQMPEGSDKEMAKKGHGTAKGSCGCLIRRCRCPSSIHNVSLTLDVPCSDCAAKAIDGNTKAPVKGQMAKSAKSDRSHEPLAYATPYTVTEDQAKPPTLALAGAGGALVGGTALARNGVQNIAFADRTKEIFDDSKRRLREFSELQQPTRAKDAINAYKDLTDAMEQMARSSDDVLARHPRIVSLAGGSFGIGKDSVRQEVVKSILRSLHPEADMFGKPIVDASQDVIGRVRAAGFKDFDRGPDLVKNFGKLQEQAAAGLQIAKRSEPHLGHLTGVLKNIGKIKTGVGVLAALGGGAWLAGYPEKKAAFSDDQTEISATTSPISALLTVRGLRDVIDTPRDILVSYGSDDRLGQGHASPGRNIADIVNNDPRFAKHNVRAIEAPTSQGLLTTTNPDALKKRYALGVDTGWGVMENHYGKQWGHRDFPTGGSLYRDAIMEAQGPFGIKSRIAGEDLLNRVQRVLKFHPDAPSTVSGNSYQHLTMGEEPSGVSGLLHRLFSNKGKYYNATYGDGSDYTGKNLSFVGRAHPAANIDNSPALSREDYRKLVAEELAASNEGTTVADWLAKIGDKKIISISGASRGDSVGARAALVYDAMRRGGDDYFILGLGGKNKLAQQAIAEAAGIPQASMGFAGFTKRFSPLAQNSDLHFMGMGGASPYEMLASEGRAPIVRAADEEVFDRVMNARNPSEQAIREWLDKSPRDDGRLNRGSGIAGKQIELARKALENNNITDPFVREALEDAANYYGARGWMNPTRLVDADGKVLLNAGEHSKLKRGLDGILDYLTKHKVRDVIFGDNGGALDSLMKDFREGRLHGLDASSRLAVRNDIAASKAGLANEVFRQWKNSRNMTRFKGVGKSLIGATALAPLLASLFGKDDKKQPLHKSAAENDALGTAGDAAMVVTGGNLIRNGIRNELSSDAMKNLQLKSYTMDYWNPEHAAELLDDYAAAGKQLMTSNPLLVPNKLITRVIPLSEWSTALTHPSAQAARVADLVGAKSIAKFLTKSPDELAALNKLRAGARHYAGFAENPHATLIDELRYKLPWLNLPDSALREIESAPTIGNAVRALGRQSDSARWQVGKFAENFFEQGRGIHAYGGVSRALGRGAILGGALTATLGLGNILRKHRSDEG